MAKNKNRIPQPDIPHSDTPKKILDISIPEPKCPEQATIGITYLRVTDKNYGLENLVKTHQAQRGNRNVLKELADFIETVNTNHMTVQQVIDKYHSKHKLKNSDDFSKKIVNELRKKNVDASDLMHLHTKSDGKGEFVLHVFINHGSVLEVVLFDPEHKLHKS